MSEAKLEILRLVAQGKVTPEEAHRLLDALDGPSANDPGGSSETWRQADDPSRAESKDTDEPGRANRLADGFAQVVEEVGETVRRAVEDAVSVAGRVFEETRPGTTSVPLTDGGFVPEAGTRLKLQQAIRVSWGGGSRGGNIIARSIPGTGQVRIVRGDAVEIHRSESEYVLTWAKGNLEVKFPQSIPGLEVRCMGGDLEIVDYPGPMSLETMGGEVRVQSPRSPFRLRTLGGRVRVAGCAIKEGVSSINTTGGDVVLETSPEASVTIHASSLGGSIEFPTGTESSSQGVGRKRAECRIAEGVGELRINTLGGDIKVKAKP